MNPLQIKRVSDETTIWTSVHNMRSALTIQPLTWTCANLAYFPCVHDTSSSYMPRATSCSSPPFAHQSSRQHRLFPVDTTRATSCSSPPFAHLSSMQHRLCLRKSRGKNQDQFYRWLKDRSLKDVTALSKFMGKAGLPNQRLYISLDGHNAFTNYIQKKVTVFKLSEI